MKCVVELSEAEEKTLQQMSLNHTHRNMRIRAAGVMMLGGKIKLTEPSMLTESLAALSSAHRTWHGPMKSSTLSTSTEQSAIRFRN